MAQDYTSDEMNLAAQDPVLAGLITQNGPIPLRPTRPYFEALARSILSQQISVKAAARIAERFDEQTGFQPHRVIALDEAKIKIIGLSAQKARYLHDLAEHFVDDSAVFDHLESLSDDDIISELTRINGIGVWTAQMFLIFTLRRPDIFAPDDRGLQLAIQKAYDVETMPNRSELEHLSLKWKPFRSTACLHLWRSLANEPKA